VQPGHTLVVPRVEIDHWNDLDPALAAHLMGVSQTIARAQQRAYSPVRVGLIVAGLEVAHTHLHVIPIHTEADLHLDRARQADPADLAAEAGRVRAALGDLGASGVSE
jgi:diadenosine tetraphosphate (Ap4A) HIT family hydrolase